jgi:selenocysteine-specific elongation factor
VHLHAYTAETIAEVSLYERKQLAPEERAFARLRLSDPILLLPDDRFIIRQFSPVITIGGGIVLDAAPVAGRKHRGESLAFLQRILGAKPEEVLAARIARCGKDGLPISDAVAQTGWKRERVEQLASGLVARGSGYLAGEVLLAREAADQLRTEILNSLKTFHDANPLVPGISRESLRESMNLKTEIFSSLLDALAGEKKLAISGDAVHLYGRSVMMRDEEAESKKTIEAAFASAGLKVPGLKEVLTGLKLDKARAEKIVTLLLRDRTLVKVADDMVFHRAALDRLRSTLAAEKAHSPRIDVGRFKDLTGVSRKYAIPLLEYLDRERVTKRVGNERVIV